MNTSPNVKSIKSAPKYQLNIFDGVTKGVHRVQQILASTDINTLTPVEVLLRLNAEMDGEGV